MANRIQQFWGQIKSIFNDWGFGADRPLTGRGASGRTYFLPGTSTDWAAQVGDMWHAPAAQACLNWIWRNFVQAPPQVYTRNADNKREPVGAHPLLALLMHPNAEYDGNTLHRALLLSYFFDGNAYAVIERAGRTGLPQELWWLPHKCIRPKRDKASGELYYEYTLRGKPPQRIARQDIWHIRFGLDPDYPLRGLSPVAAVERGIYTLQQGANYAAKAMRNAGIVGGLATPDPRTPDKRFRPNEFVDLWRQKVTGEEAGGMTAYDVPIQLQFPNVTPQNMAIDTMLDRPESDSCALFGLPPQVVGLHVGRLSKTYANVREAREAAWEECLIPTQLDFGVQAGFQLLPQLSARWQQEEVGYDISDIRPLQPDLDALWKRAGDAYKINAIDLYTFESMVGLKPDNAHKDVWYADKQPAPSFGAGDAEGEPDENEPPMRRQSRKMLGEYSASGACRRRNGHKERVE